MILNKHNLVFTLQLTETRQSKLYMFVKTLYKIIIKKKVYTIQITNQNRRSVYF